MQVQLRSWLFTCLLTMKRICSYVATWCLTIHWLISFIRERGVGDVMTIVSLWLVIAVPHYLFSDIAYPYFFFFYFLQSLHAFCGVKGNLERLNGICFFTNKLLYGISCILIRKSLYMYITKKKKRSTGRYFMFMSWIVCNIWKEFI